MNKNIIKVLSLVMAVIMLVAVFASCNKTDDTKQPGNTPDTPGTETVTKKDYTYKAGTTALGSNWNPHAWDTSADSSMLGYVTSPFVDMSIKDSEAGVYQWVYEMATAITDVTATHQGDLTKYNVKLPEGKTAAEVFEGFVYEIKLNPNAKWENGEKITADDYIYSMEQLLNPKMKNYRANLYYSGESAVAGGAAFYNSESPIYDLAINLDTDEIVEGQETYYLNLNAAWALSSSYSIKALYDMGYIYDDYQVEVDADGNPVKDADGNPVYVLDENGEKIQTAFGATTFAKLLEAKNAYGYSPFTAEETEAVYEMLDQFLAAFGVSGDAYRWSHIYYISGIGEKVDYDAVGCYKVDDYTIIYVCQSYLNINYFLTSCTSTWLVYKPLYEAGKKEEAGLLVTNYGTSKETTMSYGTYKMESLQDGKQVIYVQNENWYGFEKNEDGTAKKDEEGNLISYTNFLVDGEYVRQYTTTKVQLDVMTEDAMKNAFLKGELSEWSPSADELSQYTMSDKLYKVDETYTMSFFFNTGLETLKDLDASEKNVNSVVLSNYNFRKALSLAINRAEFVTATAGYKPAFSLMNSLYHYDIYENPESSYRNTEEAMQAIVNLYGVEYGAGKPYATLKEAHDSITGYNLTEAKALMVTAFAELKAAGLISDGANIKIQIGWAKGALTSDDNKQVALLNKYINAALEGSGFGTIEFEAVGSIQDRYAAVPAGDYAIGYGAWGGAAFYPFRNMQVYCDTVEYAGKINETGCWDPSTTELTININGEDVTKTWEEWSRACSTGDYATADFDVKLKITATMEEEFLKFYYRIPLCGTTAAFLLTFQMEYYTENYNIMYGFGGMRLMSYVYDDAAWAEVAANGLNYAG